MLTAEWKLEDALKVREKEARLDEREAIVRHMHNEGFSVADIAKATKYSDKEVKDILEQ